MRKSSPSHLWPGCQTPVNMTKAKFNRDYWSGVKIAKNWARWWDPTFPPHPCQYSQIRHPSPACAWSGPPPWRLNIIEQKDYQNTSFPKDHQPRAKTTECYTTPKAHQSCLKKVKIPVGVAELVVIPWDKLHKSWRQLNSSFGIHNGWPGMTTCCL